MPLVLTAWKRRNLSVTARAVFLCVIVCVIPFAVSGQEKSPTAHKFDEFGDDSAESVLAHLDQFASQLSNNPTMRGFIVGYRREVQPAGSFLRYVHGCREYLVTRRGVPSNS